MQSYPYIVHQLTGPALDRVHDPGLCQLFREKRREIRCHKS
jgi:hypothetical protein